MRQIFGMVLVWIGASISLGCGSARYVHKDQDGGIIAITDEGFWPFDHRGKAEELMKKHLPEGYEIVEANEVVRGKRTNNHATGNVREFHLESVHHQHHQMVQTNDITEVHLRYRRKGASRPDTMPEAIRRTSLSESTRTDR